MAAAFERSHRAGAGRSVALGADAPTLPPERVEQAFATLASGADVVLVPSHDGGYVGLGLAGPLRRELFTGIPWGGAEVAAETERRARAAGLRIVRLDGWYDVDDAATLGRLERELRDPAAARRAPQTARWLARATRDGWTPSEPP